jgi:hypothetical protein
MTTYQKLEEQHIDGVTSQGEHTSWTKNMFRKSPEWKSFVRTMLEKSDHKCQRCGCEASSLAVHHKDPKRYDTLQPELFAVLCDSCHLKIESMCKTEETMKRAPKTDRPFLTLYPYIETDKDVLAKGSGKFWTRKISREVDERRNPGKWINVQSISDTKRREVKDAVSFMKEYPELFR